MARTVAIDYREAQRTKRTIVGVACPACQKKKARVLRVGVREDPECPVFVCRHCSLQFIQPPVAGQAALREYYRTIYRTVHDAKPGVILTAEERWKYQHALSEQSVREFESKVPAGGSLLEIGCSAGGFLSRLVGRHELYGNEWNPDDAAFVRDVGEIPCEEGLLEDIFPGKTFNVIVAIHVLEHQPDPIAFLESLKKRLVGGGYLYLELPHANDPLSAVYLIKEYQDFFYREPHITYWLPHQLHWFLDSLGFEAQVAPMQRYGLLNHLNWIWNKEPMSDAIWARGPLKPVSRNHPLGASVNRLLQKLDKEYRVTLQGLWCTDSLSIVARRLEI